MTESLPEGTEASICFYGYLLDVVTAAQAPASRQRPEDFHLRVLALGEALVLALFPRWADLRMAFVEQHAVDALRVHATRVLVCCFAVAAWDLGQVGRNDLHFADRSVHLSGRLQSLQ